MALRIYINKINSGHLDLRVPRQLASSLFSHKLLITYNEFWEKKLQKNPKEKIFMSSQTFFNLTNKTKIISVINYFRKKGTTMSILNLKVNLIILFQNMLSVFHQNQPFDFYVKIHT